VTAVASMGERCGMGLDEAGLQALMVCIARSGMASRLHCIIGEYGTNMETSEEYLSTCSSSSPLFPLW